MRSRSYLLLATTACSAPPAPAAPPADRDIVVLPAAERRPAPAASATTELPRHEEPVTLSCAEVTAAFLGEPSRGHIASILNRGNYLSACGVPATTRIELCVASGDGKIVGMDVVTKPVSPGLNECLTERIRALPLPSEPGLDVTRVVFAEI